MFTTIFLYLQILKQNSFIYNVILKYKFENTPCLGVGELPVDVEATEHATAHDEECHEQQTHGGDAGGSTCACVQHKVACVLRRQRLRSTFHILLSRLKQQQKQSDMKPSLVSEFPWKIGLNYICHPS